MLSQVQNGQEKVICYYSKCFSRAERGYCVTRKEWLAAVLAVKHFHHYLYGRKFTIRTDHASLRWLINFKNLEGQLCRWINILENYDYEIVHRPGRTHGNADALSRRPCYYDKCIFCDRVEKKHTEMEVGNTKTKGIKQKQCCAEVNSLTEYCHETDKSKSVTDCNKSEPFLLFISIFTGVLLTLIPTPILFVCLILLIKKARLCDQPKPSPDNIAGEMATCQRDI